MRLGEWPVYQMVLSLAWFMVIDLHWRRVLFNTTNAMVQCIAVQCNTWRGGNLATEEGQGKGEGLAKQAGEKKEVDLETKNGVKGENQDCRQQSVQLD